MRIWITVVICALLISGMITWSGPVIGQGTANRSDFILFLTRHLHHLFPKDQTTFVRHLAMSGYYIDSPEFWARLTPEQVADAVNFFHEPFSSDLLNRLEAVLPNLTDADQKLRTAAILYRYGRASGSLYLADQVRNQSNAEAACVLAANQDAAMRDDILHLLLSAKTPDGTPIVNRKLPHLTQLITLLGIWPDPKIAQVIWGFYQQIPYAGELAVMAANQGVTESIELSRERYFKYKPEQERKWLFGAAIIKMDGPVKAKQICEALIAWLDTPAVPDDQKLTLIKALGDLKLSESNSSLRKIITQELAQSDDPTAFQNSKLSAAIASAEALANINSPNLPDRELVFQLLRHLDRTDLKLTARGYANFAERKRVARALIKLGGTEEMLAGVMGQEWYQQDWATRTLKILPDELMPK